MSEIIRFGVSLEKNLLQRFDRLIREEVHEPLRGHPGPHPPGDGEEGVGRGRGGGRGHHLHL